MRKKIRIKITLTHLIEKLQSYRMMHQMYLLLFSLIIQTKNHSKSNFKIFDVQIKETKYSSKYM